MRFFDANNVRSAITPKNRRWFGQFRLNCSVHNLFRRVKRASPLYPTISEFNHIMTLIAYNLIEGHDGQIVLTMAGEQILHNLETWKPPEIKCRRCRRKVDCLLVPNSCMRNFVVRIDYPSLQIVAR